jgi:hypothetical protein
MASARGAVQILDLDSIESVVPDTRPNKRRKTQFEPQRRRVDPVPNAKFERELEATKQKYTRTVGGTEPVPLKVCRLRVILNMWQSGS